MLWLMHICLVCPALHKCERLLELSSSRPVLRDAHLSWLSCTLISRTPATVIFDSPSCTISTQASTRILLFLFPGRITLFFIFPFISYYPTYIFSPHPSSHHLFPITRTTHTHTHIPYTWVWFLLDPFFSLEPFFAKEWQVLKADFTHKF